MMRRQRKEQQPTIKYAGYVLTFAVPQKSPSSNHPERTTLGA